MNTDVMNTSHYYAYSAFSNHFKILKSLENWIVPGWIFAEALTRIGLMGRIDSDTKTWGDWMSGFPLAEKCQLVVAPVCAQLSLQVLAGESPAMVTPESHVAYTQCWK